MKRLSEFTDREIALMLGTLHDGRAGKRSLLISEAAYRLVRSGLGTLSAAEERMAEDLHTYDFRMREDARAQRRPIRTTQAAETPQQPEAVNQRPPVISIEAAGRRNR